MIVVQQSRKRILETLNDFWISTIYNEIGNPKSYDINGFIKMTEGPIVLGTYKTMEKAIEVIKALALAIHNNEVIFLMPKENEK